MSATTVTDDMVITAIRTGNDKAVDQMAEMFGTTSAGLRAAYQIHIDAEDDALIEAAGKPGALMPLTAGVLITENPIMRQVVIDGIAREGETVNIIAAPKSHKTYSAMSMALSVVTGRPWLGVFNVAPGPVLYIDAELHPETFASRLITVAEAMDIERHEYADALHVLCLRGRLTNIIQLGTLFRRIEHGHYKLIILDALYRFMPDTFDENSNAGMAQVYNLLDQYAAATGAAFIVIHHASKGNQSEKSVTDMGAGAGAQSRAADAHLAIRPHEEEGAVVLEAVNRSFPPLAPLCLRWRFPLWEQAQDLDPAKLRTGRKKAEEQKRDEWTGQTFAAAYGTQTPVEKRLIISKAAKAIGSKRKAEDLCLEAISANLLYEWHPKSKRDPLKLATVPQLAIA